MPMTNDKSYSIIVRLKVEIRRLRIIREEFENVIAGLYYYESSLLSVGQSSIHG